MVAKDYFILANDIHSFFMFESIGFRLIDRGYVKNYRVNCMLEIDSNMCVFGHQNGVLTLWNVSKRKFSQEELTRLNKNIVDETIASIDQTILA